MLRYRHRDVHNRLASSEVIQKILTHTTQCPSTCALVLWHDLNCHCAHKVEGMHNFDLICSALLDRKEILIPGR